MDDLGLTPTMDNWNLLGHEWAVHMLQQHIVRGNVRHAYLFSGPPGLGRRALALRFAQALICPQPTAPGIPCGECRDCKGYESGTHPDLTVVQAESEGRTLKVEQVREVRRMLSLMPFQASHRVALFLRFQEASEGAANALLKTLEEAPAHVLLLLTADAPEQLLPTITSRCELLRLRPLPVESMAAHLKSSGTDQEQATLIAHLSDGRPGYALRLLGNPDVLAVRAQRLDDIQTLLAATRVEKFKYAEKMAADREAMRETLLVWSSYWRDVLLRASGAKTPLTNLDREKAISSLAVRLNLGSARTLLQDMETALKRLERNVNARLLAEVLLLDWPSL
jgi:DNA polymerase III subunit delta'